MTNAIHTLMHCAAIKKLGTAQEISSLTQLTAKEFDRAMQWSIDTGRLLEVEGKYLLSPAGQMIVRHEYSRFCIGLRDDKRFLASYEGFENINKQLKNIVTRWQTMEIGGQRVKNLHEDTDYDHRVIGELGDLHDMFIPLLGGLVSGDSRYSIYGIKLEKALDKAEDGDIQWFSDASIDSYHTVWFELHEDLLRVMGRERVE